MKRFFIILFQLVLIVAHGSAQNFKVIDKYLSEVQQKWDVPGISVAVVKNDSVVFAKAYGVKDVNDKKSQVDANTLFSIASNTKVFTATALGMLVDEGKINWDDKVVDYLPYFKLYNPYVTESMTIRDLLSHRAGLATFSGDLIWYGSTHSREEVVRRAKFLKPVSEFRTEFGYSNIMYLAAGMVVEKVSGKTWDDFVTEHILKPLNMNRTITTFSQLGKAENVALPHNTIDDKNVPINYVNWDNIAPAGSIFSSVNDMASWLKLWLNKGSVNGTQILSEDRIYEMWHPHMAKPVSKLSRSFWPSRHFTFYGLGWESFDYQGLQIVTHSGGYDGMASRTVLIPEKNMGFVFLSNNNNGLPTPIMFSILDKLMNVKTKNDWCDMFLEFQKSGTEKQKQEEYMAEQSRNVLAKNSLSLEKYCGTYGGEMYGNCEIKLEDGNLTIDFLPTPLFKGNLKHWHYETFTITLPQVPSLPKGRLRFILDKNGEVEELKIEIPNPDFDFSELEFKRIKK
ncbi:MAG: serine hydrolase [Flavobacteriales bacterium]